MEQKSKKKDSSIVHDRKKQIYLVKLSFGNAFVCAIYTPATFTNPGIVGLGRDVVV